MTQKILITGASSGFGKLFAETLCARGHAVVASMRSPKGQNLSTAAALTEKNAHVVEIDVTDENSVARGTEAAIAALEGLDVVVNNAGVGALGLQETFTAADLLKLIDVNVCGAHRINRAVLPHLREQRSGLLIHISSLLGRMVLPFMGPYNASKFALEALAENYRVELSRFGIESVIVEPGGFSTGFESRLVRPSDGARDSVYAEFAWAPEAMMASFQQNLHGDKAPNPQWVADAVTELVEMPTGKRPFRTIVDGLGMGDQLKDYNRLIEQITANVYNAFGMGNLLKIQA